MIKPRTQLERSVVVVDVVLVVFVAVADGNHSGHGHGHVHGHDLLRPSRDCGRKVAFLGALLVILYDSAICG